MSVVLREVLDGANEIFFRNPSQLRVNPTLGTRYLESPTIKVLIDEIREKGPMVAFGKMGPFAYATPPTPQEELIGELTIYGWEPGVVRLECASRYFLVIGAQKVQEATHVYFVACSDIAQKIDSLNHVFHISDATIYRISHETFKGCLLDLYAPEKSEFWRPQSVSVSFDQGFVNQLLSLRPIESIVGNNQNVCINIGHQIFQHYKNLARGNSFVGLAGMQKIYNALIQAENGLQFAQCVGEAWKNVGDSRCWWTG